MSVSEYTLTVRTSDQIAEIAIYDGNLNVLEKGVGPLQKKLPTGLYRVRIRVGSATDEKLIALDRDQTVKFDPVAFSSPIPLQNTQKSHEYHMDAAQDASGHTTKTLGAGASIMVFAREWSTGGNRSAGNPAEGLSLLDAKENLLAEIGKEADVRKSGDASAGWRADVNPGSYLLRLDLDDPDKTVLLRPIYVSPGHQIQVFGLAFDYTVERGGTVRRTDLANASIVLSPDGSFKPDDNRARLSELACHALTQSRGMWSQSLIDELIQEKFDNPMLGLFGAHLLLRDRPDDKNSFRVVTDNLLRLLGPEHPDLQALWWQRTGGPPIDDGRLHVLPMLRASWRLAVDRSIQSFDVFSFGTFMDKLPRIVPSDPWVMLMDNDWAATDEAIDVYLKSREHAHISRAQAELALKAEALQKQYFKRAYAAVRRVLPLGLASYLPMSSVASAQVTAGSAEALGASSVPILDTGEKADLARSFGIPANVLESILQKKGH